MLYMKNNSKHFLLLVLALSSTFLGQQVVASISEQCGTCMALHERVDDIGKLGKCKRKCDKQQKKGFYVLTPPCNKKACCKIICKIEDAFEACSEVGYCTSADSVPNTSSPTLTPTPQPTSKPSKAPTSTPTTKAPTKSPTSTPTTKAPTKSPTSTPTTKAPTKAPTSTPTTKAPTKDPTKSPTPPPSGFCPEYFPGDGADCGLTSFSKGTCYYSSSAQQGQIPNTDAQLCNCNFDGNSKFSCTAAEPPPDDDPSPSESDDEGPPDNWCPDYYPGSGTDCLLEFPYYGYCYWSSSAQEGEPPNTDSKRCVCNLNRESLFQCESYPFPGGIPTPPPTVTPDPPPVNWCPDFFPGTGADCLLTSPYIGSCSYSSSNQPGEPLNDDSQKCNCNYDGNSKFDCEAAPYTGPTSAPVEAPDPPPDFCPPKFPGTGTSCALSFPYSGVCYYSSSAQEGEPPNNDSQACLCNEDGYSLFACEAAPFPGPTPAPVEAPDPPPEGWCPDYFPGTGADCLLTDPWVGNCFYSSSAQEGEPPNNNAYNCRCNQNGDSKFGCIAQNNGLNRNLRQNYGAGDVQVISEIKAEEIDSSSISRKEVPLSSMEMESSVLHTSSISRKEVPLNSAEVHLQSIGAANNSFEETVHMTKSSLGNL